MTRTELLAALHAATGPDRALDAEIAALLRIVPGIRSEDYLVPLSYRAREDRTGWVGVFAIRPDGTERMIRSREALAFTASIDAALTLVPNGAFWQLLTAGDNDHGFQTSVVRYGTGEGLDYVRHDMAAIALCIAALGAMG